ncbi:histone acetyltransferase MCC1-like isoform X1 [Apium graveolens]|uniref:histone acetyltransferase MCC1-like isoform X1 n=1 Tax=Apium graveolens TaxID=4045 RepID=UPI003D79EA43
MVNLYKPGCPSIFYRPIRPSDLEVIEKLHADLFPIRYESEFFLNVVHGRDIVSWGAVDRNRSDGHSDELIGFVTARLVMAKGSEVEDVLRFEMSEANQTLVYVLTLGVVESYRNFGIATSLIKEVIKYASNITMCQAVYLHVISYNNSAIHLYEKMSFQCVRRLHSFYFINGQHYDSYLFIYYVNGGRSPCSPLCISHKTLETQKITFFGGQFYPFPSPKKAISWQRELATIFMAYIRCGFKAVASKLWKKKDRKVPVWMKCKESSGLLPTTQNKRILTCHD